MVKLNTLENNEIAGELADFIIKQQEAVLSTRERFNVAVSGGSLIKILDEGLVKNDNIKWDKWNIYFSDERIVPLNSADSNFGEFERVLLENLAHTGKVGPQVFTINESLVHEDDTANDKKIAKEYEDELPEEGIDLVLLGCGPDGHTCSLFPGHALLNSSEGFVDCLVDSPKPPPRRITLTLKYLSKCHTLCFVATGASKSDVLYDIFNNPASELPCAIVNKLPVEGGICWFIDFAAATKL